MSFLSGITDAIGSAVKAVSKAVEHLDINPENVIGLGIGIYTGNPMLIGRYGMDLLDGPDDPMVKKFGPAMQFGGLLGGDPSSLMSGDLGSLGQALLGLGEADGDLGRGLAMFGLAEQAQSERSRHPVYA